MLQRNCFIMMSLKGLYTTHRQEVTKVPVCVNGVKCNRAWCLGLGKRGTEIHAWE